MNLLSRTALALALAAAALSPGAALACCPSGGVGTPKPDHKAPQPANPSTAKPAEAAGVSVLRIGELELTFNSDLSITVRKVAQG